MLSRKTFKKLAQEIRRDTAHLSNMQAIADHPAHKKIVSYREQALPFIFDDLRSENPYTHWFVALSLITGASPIREENRGRIREMQRDWLEWAKSHGYLET